VSAQKRALKTLQKPNLEKKEHAKKEGLFSSQNQQRKKDGSRENERKETKKETKYKTIDIISCCFHA
jgi:hypothetical protein